ncbi:hypothetical protein [uncultured Gimesia sp.]|uniref:hypothetical protein n=1 Tax=uncultured Gimesia sp. TaxID=1678688 RepID=UPI00263631E1|nr:hypothetical protein [uncultured Gimesia sp.]
MKGIDNSNIQQRSQRNCCLFLSYIFLSLLLTLCGRLTYGDEPSIDVTVTVDFGKDLGQNLGTLFEATDDQGQRIFGAGFTSVYNSYYRGERYKLQFYIRPPQQKCRHEIKPIARAGTNASIFLYDLGEQVYANQGSKGGLQQWNSSQQKWSLVDTEKPHGSSASTVRGKILAWFDSGLMHGDQKIFSQPSDAEYKYYYYGQGHLFFFRKTMSIAGRVDKSLVAVRWSPYAENLNVDLSLAKTLTINSIEVFPYSWGQYGNETLTCFNYGGVYTFDGHRWKTLIEPSTQTSNQIYSMIYYQDRLLMGQYPSGMLFEYSGNQVRMLENSPPIPAAASPSVREAQTTGIYRGELFVGVWPWAELWRLNPDTSQWNQLGRLFTHPQVHSVPVHPYEAEAKSNGLVINDLGQRVTGMIPHNDSLLIGTSWKMGSKIYGVDRFDFLTPQQRKEYGVVHQLRMPGNLVSILSWQDEPTTLRFVVKEGRMAISQDGRDLATVKINSALFVDLPKTTIRWGQGVFGPLNGTLTAVNMK